MRDRTMRERPMKQRSLKQFARATDGNARDSKPSRAHDHRAVGVDLGATAVRALVLEPVMMNGYRSMSVRAAGSVDLAPGVVVDGEVKEPAAVTLALKQLWRTYKIRDRSVILGIANPQVTVRDLSVPNLDRERRAKALPYQAKDVIALPLSEVILDFCEVGAPDPQAETVDGLLVAAPREPVLTAVRAVEKAGLKITRVDLASLGMLRAAATAVPRVEALIDLGAHLTTIVIHENGTPKLVRTLTRGAEELTRSLAERMDLELAEAEMIKRQYGLETDHAEMHRALIEALRPLIAELRTSLGYFRSANGAALESLSLSGGGALLPGIAPALTDQLGVPATVVNPLQHLTGRAPTRNDRFAPETMPSAVSVGLALGAAA